MSDQPQRLSGDRIAEYIIERFDAGDSTRDLARVMGVSQRQMQRWVRLAGRGRASEEDQRLLVSSVHRLRHDEGLSVRAIVGWLGERGVRRSIGWVHTALTTWTCDACSIATPDATEQVVEAGAEA